MKTINNPLNIDAKSVSKEELAADEITKLFLEHGNSVGLTDIRCDINFWSGVEIHISSEEGVYMTSTVVDREFDLVGLLSVAREIDRPRLTILLKQVHMILRRHKLSR